MSILSEMTEIEMKQKQNQKGPKKGNEIEMETFVRNIK